MTESDGKAVTVFAMTDQKVVELVPDDGKTNYAAMRRLESEETSAETPRTPNNQNNNNSSQEMKSSQESPAPAGATAAAGKSGSLESVSLYDQIDGLVAQLEEERIREHFELDAPWSFDLCAILTCKSVGQEETLIEKIRAFFGNVATLLKYSVPPLILILIIIADASREDRKDSGISTCQISAFVNETVYDSNYPYFGLSVNNSNSMNYEINGYYDCFDLENDGLSDKKPPSEGWKILLSLIPFVCVFQGVLGYDLSSRYVAPFTLMVTVYIGMVFFEDEGWWLVEHEDGTITKGNAVEAGGLVFLTIVDRIVWTIFEYAFNVFTAFFFLRVLEYWGVVDQMRIEFEEMCPSNAKKITLILFCFAVMIAVVAPGGSNFLIAGAIMIEINHSLYEPGPQRDNYDINVGTICLFGNGLTSAFNLVGVCIIAISSDIMELADSVNDNICSVKEYPEISDREICAAKQIGGYFSMMFFIFSVISPVLMALLYEATFENSKLIPKFSFSKFSKDDWAVMLLCGFVYATVQLLCAWFVGPELVCLLAAGFALAAYYTFQQCWVYGKNMHGKPNFGKRKFALPFVLLITILCVVRLIPGVEDFLEGDGSETAENILYPAILSVNYLDYSFNRHFGWLAHSGMAVLIVSILTPFVTPYFDYEKAMEEKELKQRKNPQPLYTPLQGLQDLPTNRKNNADKVKSKLKKRDASKKTKKRILAEMNATMWQKRVWVLREALFKSIGEALPVMVSIGAYASIAKIMAGFNMTQTIAIGIVDLLDGLGRSGAQSLYAFFIPIIGMLGSGLTGSTTTSNFLFGQLQVQTAIDLDLVANDYNSVWEIAGDQIFGSTTGEIISPMNAVFSTLLLAGRFKESVLMNRLLLMALVWGLCASLVSMLFIVPKGFIS